LALLGGFLGMLPQFIYWKYTTGSWIYDVGSKWTFANPWWRVLIGFEKGWFIYTPIAIFMVLGLFFMKGKPFRKAVLTFCLLNIWIVISWFDWRYGGTYSSRAMLQSYPVFALAFAALLERVFVKKWKAVVLIAGTWLGFVNLFQIWQYNRTILHYDHMNAKYYKAIFLDSNPTSLDYSFLDTEEELTAFGKPKKQSESSYLNVKVTSLQSLLLFQTTESNGWLVTDVNLFAKTGIVNGTIHVASFKNGKIVKERRFRLAVPGAKNGQMNYLNHYILMEKSDSTTVAIESWSEIDLKEVKVKSTIY
jgi:hypothetical protein